MVFHYKENFIPESKIKGENTDYKSLSKIVVLVPSTRRNKRYYYIDQGLNNSTRDRCKEFGMISILKY